MSGSTRPRVHRARLDPTLRATVTAKRPLRYHAGADVERERPGHVRAASGASWLFGTLVVVQDDAAFLALISADGRVQDVPLPVEDGTRLWDDRRGNKAKKPDLEACFVDGELFVALGSGSTPARERVVLARRLESDAAEVTMVEAPELYARMRAEPAFAGSELNVEGAVVHGDDVVLLQRGNGAGEAVDAVARVARAPLVAYLAACARRVPGVELECPPLRDVTPYDLGHVGGTRLTFTDGAVDDAGRLAFLACAEASPDTYRDGPVSGVALGLLGASGEARYALVTEADGSPMTAKAEGLAFVPGRPGRALVVIDRDDPDAPAELVELAMHGFHGA